MSLQKGTAIVTNPETLTAQDITDIKTGLGLTPVNVGAFTGELNLSNTTGSYFSDYNIGTSGQITFSIGANATIFGFDYIKIVSDGVTEFATQANLDAIFDEQYNLPDNRIFPAGTYALYIKKTPTGVAINAPTNQYQPDITSPEIISATVENANPNQLVVVFSEAVNINNITGLSLDGGLSAINITSIVSGSGTDTITLGLDANVSNGDTGNFIYGATNTIADLDGNALASGQTVVTNNVQSADDLPFFSDAVFYVNRFYDSDITVDGSNRITEWVNRADINNNLTNFGVADADLPVDDNVGKTVRLETGKQLNLQSDILYNSSNCTMVIVGENDNYASQGNVILATDVQSGGTPTFWNFRNAGRSVFIYPGTALQFSSDDSSANPVNSYHGKMIFSTSFDRPNGIDYKDIYNDNRQATTTQSRNVSSNTTAFLNELNASNYGAGEGINIRTIIVYNRTLTQAELVTLRNYILNQYPIPAIP